MEAGAHSGASTAGPSSSNKSNAKASNAGGNGQANRDTKPSKEATQNRTRITVVCAECKRLKLKCDRKNPCGSCAKKNITQCVYSQQATEKVDVQSLNNRVMLIELAFMRFLQGRPADYVPTYPPVIEDAQKEGLVIPTASESSSVERRLDGDDLYAVDPLLAARITAPPHAHHHHLAAPASSSKKNLSMLLALVDMLKELREGLSLAACEASEDDGDHCHDEAECQTVHSLKREPDSRDDVDMLYTSPLDPTTSSRAQRALPPISVYYIDSPGADCHESTRPGVTPALCNLLPTVDVCMGYLDSAKNTTVFSTLSAGSSSADNDWDKFVDQCRHLMTAGHRSRSSSGTGHPSFDRNDETLPFFSLLCAVLAVGASRAGPSYVKGEGSSVDHGSSSFLFALSQQASDVWLQHSQEDASVDADRQIHRERADYFRAALVQISLLVGCRDRQAVHRAISSGQVSANEQKALTRTLTQIVSVVQSWDTDSVAFFSLAKGEAEWSVEVEAFKRIWWEFLSFDLLFAEAAGRPCLVPNAFYDAVPLPSLDVNVFVKAGNVPYLPEVAQRVAFQRLSSAAHAGLTLFAFKVKAGIATPSCCCGYTLDQAITLMTDLKAWAKSLPSGLLWAFDNAVNLSSAVAPLKRGGDKPPSTDERSSAPTLGFESSQTSPTEFDILLRILSCELAIHAESLVLKIYAPFVGLLLRPTPANEANATQLRHALTEFIGAAQATIRVGSTLHNLLAANPRLSSSLDLVQIVLDATITCSRVCLPRSFKDPPAFARVLGLTGQDPESINLMQDIKLGLDTVETMFGPRRMSSNDVDPTVVKTLRKRYTKRAANFSARCGSLKRKHSTIIDAEDSLPQPRPSPGALAQSDSEEYEDVEDGPAMPESSNASRAGSTSQPKVPAGTRRNVMGVVSDKIRARRMQKQPSKKKTAVRFREKGVLRTTAVLPPLPSLGVNPKDLDSGLETVSEREPPPQDPFQPPVASSSSVEMPVVDSTYRDGSHHHSQPGSAERSRAGSFSHNHEAFLNYVEPRSTIRPADAYLTSLSVSFTTPSAPASFKPPSQSSPKFAVPPNPPMKVFTGENSGAFSSLSSSEPPTPYSGPSSSQSYPGYSNGDFYPPTSSTDNHISQSSDYAIRNASHDSLMHQPTGQQNIYAAASHNISMSSLDYFHPEASGFYQNDAAAYSSSSIQMTGPSSASYPSTPLHALGFEHAGGHPVDSSGQYWSHTANPSNPDLLSDTRPSVQWPEAVAPAGWTS